MGWNNHNISIHTTNSHRTYSESLYAESVRIYGDDSSQRLMHGKFRLYVSYVRRHIIFVSFGEKTDDDNGLCDVRNTQRLGILVDMLVIFQIR